MATFKPTGALTAEFTMKLTEDEARALLLASQFSAKAVVGCLGDKITEDLRPATPLGKALISLIESAQALRPLMQRVDDARAVFAGRKVVAAWMSAEDAARG